MENRVSIRFVNGDQIRREVTIYFDKGGHHWKHSFIPEEEIWVEDEMPLEETKEIIKQEIAERHLMRDKGYLQKHAENATIQTTEKIKSKKTPISYNTHSLRVFDFDDTLVKSDQRIKVKHTDGKITKLTPLQYAAYKTKPGDKFDYSDFRSKIPNPKKIPIVFDYFKGVLKQSKESNVRCVILTARTYKRPVERFIKATTGENVEIIVLRSPGPEATPVLKEQWVEERIKEGYKDIVFFDDYDETIERIKALSVKYPSVSIKLFLVKNRYTVVLK